MKGEFAQSYVHEQIDTAKLAQRPEIVEAYKSLKRMYDWDGVVR